MTITVVETKQCGMCMTNDHDKCVVGTKHQGRHLKYPYGVVWQCGCCGTQRRKCADCGNRNTEEVNPDTWTCLDTESCQDTVERRREANPFFAQLRDIQERVQMAKIENDKAKAEKRAAAKPKTGTCVCGCNGTTKGGKFLPGHDARFVSTLVGKVTEANFKATVEKDARKSLREAGASDALTAKFEKSLGLAKEKRDKREAAKAEKAKEKATASA